MSGLVDSALGAISNAAGVLGGKSHAPSVNMNQPFRTGYSSIINGTVSLDPTIRKIQNQALGNYSNLYSSLGANRNQFLKSVTGNRNAFIQARVDPLKASLGRGRAALQQGLQRRGVYGSFANQDLANYDSQANSQLGDATAQALQDALNSQVQGDTTYANAMDNQNSGIDTIAQQRLTGELQALGLSNDTISNLLGAQLGSAKLQDKASQYGAQMFGNLLEAGGKMMKLPGLGG